MACKNKMKKLNKKAAIGEGILMIYRLFLVAIIAIIILGVSAIFYDYYINVRDVEARIMAKQTVNCLVPDGIIDLNKIKSYEQNFLKDLCGINNLDRFYVTVNVSENNNQVILLQQGDSGAAWIKDIFKNKNLVSKIEKYEPGQFNRDYPANLVREGKSVRSNINVEVFVNNEF